MTVESTTYSRKANHTPPPWVVGVRPDGSKWISRGDPSRGAHNQSDFAGTDADAALTVAAPDLLEALKAAHYALANIAEGFAYEDGDSEHQPCPHEELCGEAVCNECGCIRDKRDEARAAIAKAEGLPNLADAPQESPTPSVGSSS